MFKVDLFVCKIGFVRLLFVTRCISFQGAEVAGEGHLTRPRCDGARGSHSLQRRSVESDTISACKDGISIPLLHKTASQTPDSPSLQFPKAHFCCHQLSSTLSPAAHVPLHPSRLLQDPCHIDDSLCASCGATCQTTVRK